LVRKSTAPAFIARTLLGTSPWRADEDDSSLTTGSRQCGLQLEAIEAGHGQIEDHRRPGRRLRHAGPRKSPDERNALTWCPRRTATPARSKRPQDARIVVDQEDGGDFVVHAHPPA